MYPFPVSVKRILDSSPVVSAVASSIIKRSLSVPYTSGTMLRGVASSINILKSAFNDELFDLSKILKDFDKILFGSKESSLGFISFI